MQSISFFWEMKCIKSNIFTENFKIHHIEGWIEEIYIVEYSDKILLLDGATSQDTEKIYHFITKKLNRKITDLKLSLVSHLHPDHSAAAYKLRQQYNIPIAAHKNIDDWYKGFGGRFQHKMDELLAFYVSRKQKRPFKILKHPVVLKPDYFIDDGDNIPFFEDWKVIFAPGHTNHQLTFYHPEEKILYAADVAVCVNQRLQLPYPVELKDLAKNTLLKLSELDVETLLLAHGGIIQQENVNNLFLTLLPKLYNKPSFPLNLIKYFVGRNSVLKVK